MRMEYLWLKTTHMVLAATSITGFVARGVGRMSAQPWTRHRWVQIAPHVIDTLFLATGIWLAWVLGASPMNSGWLGAKITGLVAYIVLGMFAFRVPQQRVRVASFVLALAAFTYVALVAFTKRPGIWI